jgi:hypothetical protein
MGALVFGMSFHLLASLANVNIGRISLVAVDKAIYSASVVDKAISVCSFDAHTKGQFANVIMYPVRDLAVVGSSAADCCFQSPA